MGLFSFLKNAGSKVLKEKEVEIRQAQAGGMVQDMINQQKASTLVALVESMNLEVSHLDVQVMGEKVTISGAVNSYEDREKVILTVGNVNGIAEVEDNIEVLEPLEEVVEANFYTVEKGDSLSKIAKAQYGDAMKYPLIFEANKPMLSDPSKIYPGQVLRIPPLMA